MNQDEEAALAYKARIRQLEAQVEALVLAGEYVYVMALVAAEILTEPYARATLLSIGNVFGQSNARLARAFGVGA